MSIANKKSVMTMYSGAKDMYSHRSRIVLAEKGVSVDIIEVDRLDKTEEIAELNPYGTVPILVDRDLVLYESRIIMEYLDERFPHPPLLPVYPVARAHFRLLMHRVDRDWCSLVHKIESASAAEQEAARKELGENLASLASMFKETPYFMSEEFTLVDCCLAPIMWRLPVLGIELPKTAASVEVYANRVFEREAFQASLTEAERELRLELEGK